MASLGALVADLSSGAQGATVGRGAVARDVAELAAGVALHSLSLAVTGEVVGTTALVASGGTGVALEAATETALEATAGASGTASAGGSAGGSGVGAVALDGSVLGEYIMAQIVHVQQGGRAGCSCSSGR